MTESSVGVSRSESVEQALLWAEACASIDGFRRQVTENEIFLGVLLAHPDLDGEMQQFLDHFELTARDLLPGDYPAISVESLKSAAKTVDQVRDSAWSLEATEVMNTAGTYARAGLVQVAHVMAGLLSYSSPWQDRLRTALSRYAIDVSAVASGFVSILPGVDENQPSAEKVDLSGGITAGAQIGDWLDENFPRKPATLAGFASDEVVPTQDFVGVGAEADAFAYLIASKALVPPLAIGLFGTWGSGKSFLMAKIERRVKELTDLARNRGGPDAEVWTNIAAVRFNAWQYVETDLWAALLHHIFDTLSPEAREQLSRDDKERNHARDALAQHEEVLKHAQEAATAREADEARALQAVQAAETELRNRRVQAEQVRVALVAHELEGSARQTLRAQITTAAGGVLGEETVRALGQAREALAESKGSPWLLRQYWSTRRRLYVVLTGLLVPGLAYGVGRLRGALPALATALAVAVPIVAFGLRRMAGFVTEQKGEYARAQKTVNDRLDTATRDAEEARDAAVAELATSRDTLRLAQAEAVKEQGEHDRRKQGVMRLTPGGLYTDFISGRVGSDDYRKRLSLVTTVHDDLLRLANLSNDYNEKQGKAPQRGRTGSGNRPRGPDPKSPPNRIVLYIDDLDRCPPKRVVEVLEAVHLLLAFKLFVVIVAVDTRWLEFALPKALEALRPSTVDGSQQTPAPVARDEMGAPTPHDYIEKIFQIPFWVEPLDTAARQRIMHGLMQTSVSIPGGKTAVEGTDSRLVVNDTRADLVRGSITTLGSWLDRDAQPFSLTPDELVFLESLAPLLEGSPRQVKRYVNTCQFLLAMAPPLSADGDPPTERMAACFMAALNDSMPRLAARLAQPAGATPNADPVTLASKIASLGPNELTAERKRLDQWMNGHTRDPALRSQPAFGLTPIQRFTKRWDTIRRVRFNYETLPGPAEPADD